MIPVLLIKLKVENFQIFKNFPSNRNNILVNNFWSFGNLVIKTRHEKGQYVV